MSALLALAFVLRLLYLVDVTSTPGFEWHDPDSYADLGYQLAEEGEGWRWSFEAVRHAVEGRVYVLPPLYPAFLSVFGLLPGFPFTAQLAQLVLGTSAVLLVFLLGRLVHSPRAGLVAAAIYSLWFPNIILVWSTMQEALYVPLLLLGFVLFLGARAGGRGFWAYGSAGLVFGLATLTRSMPLYFLPLAVGLHVFWANDRKRASLSMVALVAGFAATTLPYSLALSSHLGQATFVENHGAVRILERFEGAGRLGADPPGLSTTVALLTESFLEDPAVFLRDSGRGAASMLHVNGGRLLQIYIAASGPGTALVWKLCSQVAGDLFLVASLLLAPLGYLWSRHSRAAGFLVLWVLVNLLLVSLSGFGGARLRMPIEPHLVVLASVVLVGSYRHRMAPALALVLGTLVAMVPAAVTLPQLPSSWRARADYGVDWPRIVGHRRSVMTERCGFNLLAARGRLRFELRRPKAVAPGSKALVEVRLNGEVVDAGVLVEERRRLRYDWPSVELVFVELKAEPVATTEGGPARVAVIPRR